MHLWGAGKNWLKWMHLWGAGKNWLHLRGGGNKCKEM